jgi:hypothetical protein
MVIEIPQIDKKNRNREHKTDVENKLTTLEENRIIFDIYVELMTIYIY